MTVVTTGGLSAPKTAASCVREDESTSATGGKNRTAMVDAFDVVESGPACEVNRCLQERGVASALSGSFANMSVSA